ncbi:MAG: hypothetical protein H7257_07845, partial [Taibaiella sp.]|nr:hypothetical protein [Taibaiella sp.]
MRIIKFTLFLLFFPVFVHAQIITTIAGGGTTSLGDGGPATAGAIGYFASLAVDSHGNVYIGDGNYNRVRKVDAVTGIITTFAGTGSITYNG